MSCYEDEIAWIEVVQALTTVTLHFSLALFSHRPTALNFQLDRLDNSEPTRYSNMRRQLFKLCIISQSLIIGLPLASAFPSQTTVKDDVIWKLRAHRNVGDDKSVLASTGEPCNTSAMSRQDFFKTTMAAGLFSNFNLNPLPALAFEGGIGGLGKTKPETGVEFFSADEKLITQGKNGIVSAEIAVHQQPLLVSFYAPPAWPLSGTAAGLEARDLAQPEATYVHVVTTDNTNSAVNVEKLPIVEITNPESGKTVQGLSKSALKEVLLQSVLAQQGKFGAFGSPTDIKVKKWKDASAPMALVGGTRSLDLGIYQVSFVTLTPGLRESERVLLVNTRLVQFASANNNSSSNKSALVMLVTGTTRQRFSSQETLLERVSQSWEVVPAPPSRLKEK